MLSLQWVSKTFGTTCLDNKKSIYQELLIRSYCSTVQQLYISTKRKGVLGSKLKQHICPDQGVKLQVVI